MRLYRRPLSADAASCTKADADKVTAACAATDRVCGPACSAVCPSCGSARCRCHCSADCPIAPAALSSDPDRFPVEAGMVPLVFELKRLGVFTPCWSCEGHNDVAGALWKLPRVWFYADSVVHVRLLAECIAQLTLEGRLHCTWHVGVTVAESANPDTLFQLEPVPGADGGMTLDRLRQDVLTLAGDVHERMIGAAGDLSEQTRPRPSAVDQTG